VTALMAMPAVFDEHETRVRAKRMGRAIEARMLQLGMTQVDLARRMGVAQGRVSEWVNGERYRSGKGPQSLPVGWNVEMVARLEHELGIPGVLFHAGGYVDPADVRSLPVSARDIEHLIKHSLDLEEAAKPSLMAGVRAARREPVGD
jgi:transcriptional regulator with XRE-family HTH domain